MSTMIDITPSPAARRLFSSMVARADGPTGMISLASTLALSVKRKAMGIGPERREVQELQTEGWITPADDGGWRIL